MKYSCLLILFLAVACGDTDFKKVEQLDEFRILSVVTSTPEVAPGTPGVTLELFVSDVKSGGRIINGTTVSCIDPGISFGAEVNCDHDPSAFASTYTVDTTALNLGTGLTGSLSINVPAGIFIGRSAREQFNGVGYITIFNFQVDGKTVTAFKRVVATNRAAKNTNPSGSAILLNGAAIGSAPGDEDKLLMTSNAPETYDYINSEGGTETRTEEMQVAWYVTLGKFDTSKSDVNETVKYLGSTATVPFMLVGIVRDERGGVQIIDQFFP